MSEKLKVYSGECYKCDAGRHTGEVDMRGEPLFTGDIVQLWHGEWIGTDDECWYPSTGLTVIVADQYQSFSDGSFKLIDGDAKPYTMGIAKCGVQNEEWRVKKVKSYEHITKGERIVDYGFNFR